MLETENYISSYGGKSVDLVGNTLEVLRYIGNMRKQGCQKAKAMHARPESFFAHSFFSVNVERETMGPAFIKSNTFLTFVLEHNSVSPTRFAVVTVNSVVPVRIAGMSAAPLVWAQVADMLTSANDPSMPLDRRVELAAAISRFQQLRQ